MKTGKANERPNNPVVQIALTRLVAALQETSCFKPRQPFVYEGISSRPFVVTASFYIVIEFQTQMLQCIIQ